MLVLAPLITTSAGIPVDFFALPLFLYIEAQSVKLSWEISLNLVNYYWYIKAHLFKQLKGIIREMKRAILFLGIGLHI
ncbi:hypothetical protein MTo_00509 [Microcystis aeruginosa NIES-1211]|uniref:Uncharacterized protein n=1 Tax=Microcystis aeruginosa KW TaxID=1960155 RepID=A0A1V4BMP3_MICAE|nr:hypothetical protein B1L04_22105 [Microcystis aeruginosa KW]GBL13219.1 hypothetical protein MTo_00509 [Microcystis aeruginosa NIES-1211]